MEALTGIFLLATLVEGTINYIAGDDHGRPWIKYVALALGVVAAIAYQVDIPAMAGLESAIPFVSYIVSGLIIGRGSNYLNDIIGKVRA